MPTLIFTPRYTDDSQALWKAAAALGWQVERLTGWRVPDHLQNLPEPVFYGEALFGPTLAEQLGIRLLNPPEDWLVQLPMEYKLRNISLQTLGEARGLDQPYFIKPPNDKSFPADVYLGSALPAEYDDDMPVLVSDVVTWEKEFRCFILNRKLMTYSVYSRFGDLQREAEFASTVDEDQALLAFMQTLLNDSRVDLPAAAVLDVGTLAGAGWACVEQNAAWGAGIYGCDPVAVLEVLRCAGAKLG
ncbi:ATP-grasp domain-containing protein [Undibacterium sp. CY18W]|uniref:ATP-grasp domain-containing protein n=1 Tax=Undibacterium hunanense TaxID=2762292 RepID=A0ABR6ZTG3_9BURK|nr:ATP-grasp domain-containing protein [Undibacterium hunanense]MBC3919197.1 ATP-grasp domain-containing protein [Undibacterium hunanense]